MALTYKAADFWKAVRDPEADEPDLEDRQASDQAAEGADTTPGGSREDTPEGEPPPTDPSGKDPASLFWDPFAIVEQLGYRDKPSSITYATLKSIVWRTPVIRAIIQTRLNQIGAFCQVQRDRYHLGYRVKTRDAEHEPTGADKKWVKQMESLLQRTGVTENPRGRDGFETFVRKIALDSLMYDAMTFEVVPDRKGRPCEWYAIDSSTIRLADSAAVYLHQNLDQAVKYVQIYDGMIITEYTQDELCYGVRNPSTDIRLYGYGTAEIEMAVEAITGFLFGFEYNKKAFSQGSMPKGLLNIKGLPEKHLKAFRRHWYTMLSGVENAFRLPILSADDLQWTPMNVSNREMEYSAWLDFLIKVICSLFSIDPIEVNFQYGNQGQRSALNSPSNREKITESKERGLRPLLRFLSNCINRHIIWPINESFEFEFVGLDSMTREQWTDVNTKRVNSFRTIDEIRAEDDYPPLPDHQGKIILNPTWVQWAGMQQQQQQAQQQPQGAPGMTGTEQPGMDMGGQPQGQPEGAQAPQEQEQPFDEEQYAQQLEQQGAEPVQKSLASQRVIFDVKL